MSGTGWSLAEIRALSVTAARGTGYPHGLAQEAGFAVEFLQARCAPGAAALAALLDSGRPPAENCPLTLGAGLSDGALVLADLERMICQPLLLIPFIVTTHPDVGHRIAFGDSVVEASPAGISIEGDPLARSGRVQLTGCTMPTGECTSRVPATAERAVKRLTIHASRTYAPETAASRLSGAGAGLTDND